MGRFDFDRFWRFFRFEAVARWPELMWITILPGGLYLLWATKTMLLGSPVQEFGSFSLGLGMFAGLSLATTSYRQEMNGNTAPAALLLPVAEIERFICRWIMTAIFPILGPLLILLTMGNIFSARSAFVYDLPFKFLAPEPDFFYAQIPFYILCHSIVFAGGLFFRTRALFKTMFAVMAYLFITGVGTFAFTLSQLAELVKGNQEGIINLFAAPADLPLITMRVAWQVVFPLLMYIAAYWKARELEVRA
jgi:hypothetical protein